MARTRAGALASAGQEEERPVRGPWALAWFRFRRKKLPLACLGIILAVYLAGVFAPFVASQDYNKQDLDQARQAPSLEHPLGTDRLGRDQYSRIVYGARTAAIVSILSVSFGTVAGVVMGGLSGYFGGRFYSIVQPIEDILFAFPGMLLLILIAATVKPRVVEFTRAFEDATGISGLVKSGVVDYFVIFAALALFAWPGMSRLVRGQILALRETEYVEAARAIGSSGWTIIRRHLLPNSMAPVIVSVSFGLGGAVTGEVVLSWLGIGIQPPNPSWGRMIWENQAMLRTPEWYLLVGPIVVVGLIFFCFALLGDGINDVLNPRAR